MADAELGDDVYGEDPTVNRLEALTCALLGKEASLFVASGTMGNLVALLAHTARGDQVILGDRSHIARNELGGGAVFGSLLYRTLSNDDGGGLDPGALRDALQTAGARGPRTGLVCLENTHTSCTGAVLGLEDTVALAKTAHDHGVPVHLDGARLFNAAVALGVPARALVADVDSVSFCLSKGLSAPAGAMLSGSVAFVAKARGYRRMVGGGMRQVGMLAAAGIVALEQGIGFLAGDHARARRLAEGLQTIPGFGVAMERVQTNLVVAEVRHGSAAALVSRLDAAGVRLRAIGPRQVRTQTHRMISAADIEEALDRIAAVMKRDVGAQEERT